MRSLSPLPIDALISQIAATVRDRASVVLTATPGAGKTTRLPPALLQSVVGKIAILQPRRMAAVAACNWVCEEQEWRVGERLVFKFVLSWKMTRSTRLLFDDGRPVASAHGGRSRTQGIFFDRDRRVSRAQLESGSHFGLRA